MAQDEVILDLVTGHLLGEFAAMVVIADVFSVEDNLKLILNRSSIGQKASGNAPIKTSIGAVT